MPPRSKDAERGDPAHPPVDPVPGPHGLRDATPDGPRDAAPPSPAIPSFASLRAPRRSTPALDLLVPGHPDPPAPSPARQPPHQPVHRPEEPVPSSGPQPQPPPPPSPGGPAPRGSPRPAEYGDLVRLGAQVTRTLAALPVRVALWSLREQVRLLRRLLGEPAAPPPAAGGERRA